LLDNILVGHVGVSALEGVVMMRDVEQVAGDVAAGTLVFLWGVGVLARVLCGVCFLVRGLDF
jgi:hypothetical protein